MADSNTFTEEQRRRRRIGLYKKIIIIIILILILLPTVFCVILFIRVGNMQKQINTLMVMRMAYEDTNNLVNDNPVYEVRVREIEPDAEVVTEHGSDASYIETESTQETPELASKETDKVAAMEETMYGAYSESMIEDALKEGRKVVYLTFDDGPSNNTDKILDVLSTYNVKATFFTVGNNKDSFTEQYKRIVSDGHSLGMHSFSHQYKDIYSSIDSFDRDFARISSYLEDMLGFAPTLYRFPGGSSNLVSGTSMTTFIKYLNERNIRYFDWNASAKDAEGRLLSSDEIVNNILRDIEQKDICVVLMHDSDNLPTTVEALPKLIEELQRTNSVLLPITENTTLIQHIKAEDVK